MQLGKNRYTNSNKKAYRKPELEVVEMDREMTLIMMSPPPDNGDVGDNGTLPVSQGTTRPDYKNYNYPKKESPFGGGTPDFER